MLGGSAGVSGDVLAGRDSEITWEDVYRGMLFSRLTMTLLEKALLEEVDLSEDVS